MSQVGVTPANEEQAVCTHLHKRDNRYYFRRKIPLDLQAHYGRKEIVKALGTSDRKEAVRLCRAVGVKVDAEFEEVRAQLLTASVPAESAPEPARVNADEVAQRTLASIRRRADEAAVDGTLEEFNVRVRSAYSDAKAVLRGDLPPILGPRSYHEGQRNAMRAFLKGDGSVREGTFTPAPSSGSTAPIAAPGNTSLREMVEKWATERGIKSKSKGEAQLAVRYFTEHLGDYPVQQITKVHAVRFKDKLADAGFRPKNINKQIRMLSALMGVASAALLIEANPFSNVRAPIPKNLSDKRKPWAVSDLHKLFAGSVHSGGGIPKSGRGQAAYWLPLLALFSGARGRELAQLSPDDVFEEVYIGTDDKERKAWVLRLTTTGDDEGDGVEKSIKNAGSVRRFPVHPELIRLGFLDVVKAAKGAGRSRIFHKLTPNKHGDIYAVWGQWFGRYKKACGITDGLVVFHSFRHLFKDTARAVGIAEDVQDAITGHEGGGVARTYGGLSYPLPPLVEAMNRYRIPGLTLPTPATVEKRGA